MDCGADLSLIGSKRFKESGGDMTRLVESPYVLTGIKDEVIDCHGMAEMKVSFGKGVHVTHWFHVVDGVTSDLLLGYDFLKPNDIDCRFGKGEIVVQGKTFPLEDHPYMRSLVRLGEDVTIPANSYTIARVKGKFKGQHLISAINTGFIGQEPGLTVTNTLLDNMKPNRSYPIRLVNTTSRDFTLKKGNVIAQAEDDVEVQEATDLDDQVWDSTPADDTINVPEKYRQAVETLLAKYEICASSDMELGRTNLIKLKIETGENTPFRQRPYRVPLAKRDVIDRQVEEMLKAEVITECHSPWCSPVVLVKKKKTGEYRFCIDFRKLNLRTVKYNWPLPVIDDILASLGEARYFSCMDLRSGYWQVGIEEKDKDKTAFACHKGIYRFEVMPFGLTNAPSVFTELMQKVLAGLDSFCRPYLDDVVIYSRSEKDHFKHLGIVFDRIKNAGLKLKKSKCEFFAKRMNYLGHLVTPDGILPDPEKVRVMTELAPPTCVREVRGFIGMASYYRKFLDSFSEIALPLTRLTRKHARFHWDAECQAAFDHLKSKLADTPILAYPVMGKPFLLYTDASDKCVGAVLTQVQEGEEKVIQYVSHKLSDTQFRWPTVQKEAYAIYYATEKLWQYLYGAEFRVKTDHQPLKYLFDSEQKNLMVQRWAMKLSEYDCLIDYLPGKKNTQADFLSRLPSGHAGIAVVNSDRLGVDQWVDSQMKRKGKQIDKKELIVPESEFEDIKQEQEKDANLLAYHQDKRYCVIEGILYYISEEDETCKIVIPSHLKQVVLSQTHDIGHTGIERTYDNIREKYHWVGIYRDVVRYVTKCMHCLSRNLVREQRPVQEMDQSGVPFQKVSIDLAGPYEESYGGNRYLFSLVDHYTGWPEFFAIPDKRAETVANIILNEIIPRHTCPLIMLSDRGSEFVNEILSQVCKHNNIFRIKTSKYHPASNGKVERVHRTWNDMVAKSLLGEVRLWDTMIPDVLLFLRNSPCKTNGQTPFFMLHLRDSVMPLDTLMKPRQKYLGEEFHKVAFERQHKIYVENLKRQKKAQSRQESLNALKTKTVNFEVGSPVYLFNYRRTSKLDIKWRPYFRIVTQHSPVNFSVKNVLTGEVETVHSSHLRLAPEDWGMPGSQETGLGQKRQARYVVSPVQSESEGEVEGLGESSSEEDYGNPRERVPRPPYPRTDSDSEWDSEDDIPLALLRQGQRPGGGGAIGIAPQVVEQPRDPRDENPRAPAMLDRPVPIEPPVAVANALGRPQDGVPIPDIEMEEVRKRVREGEDNPTPDEVNNDDKRRRLNRVRNKRRSHDVKSLLQLVANML